MGGGVGIANLLNVVNVGGIPLTINGVSVNGVALNGLGLGLSGEEPPMYVNAKQYHRILKRRIQRAKQEMQEPSKQKVVP